VLSARLSGVKELSKLEVRDPNREPAAFMLSGALADVTDPAATLIADAWPPEVLERSTTGFPNASEAAIVTVAGLPGEPPMTNAPCTM
jgi:hypothetical protein